MELRNAQGNVLFKVNASTGKIETQDGQACDFLNHTHSVSNVTSLQTALDGKAATTHTHVKANITDFSHTHPQSEVTNLVSDLAGKAASSHSHAQSDVTNLVSDLAGKAAASHTHIIANVTGLQTALDGKSDVGHTHPGGSAFTLTEFTKDLGAARISGTFDVTGLSGLTADKPVLVTQTAAQIASKGNARDEMEFDKITVTGYVVNSSTIRCYWRSTGVVVGTYAFGYSVSA